MRIKCLGVLGFCHSILKEHIAEVIPLFMSQDAVPHPVLDCISCGYVYIFTFLFHCTFPSNEPAFISYLPVALALYFHRSEDINPSASEDAEIKRASIQKCERGSSSSRSRACCCRSRQTSQHSQSRCSGYRSRARRKEETETPRHSGTYPFLSSIFI